MTLSLVNKHLGHSPRERCLYTKTCELSYVGSGAAIPNNFSRYDSSKDLLS